MNNPRVFTPHPVLVRTESGMRWKFDIERIVRDYGPIVTLVDNSSIILTPAVAFAEMARALISNQFDPTRDYFLAAGDMTLYGAMLLISRNEFNATPKQLRHSKKFNEYDVLPVMRFETTEEING